MGYSFVVLVPYGVYEYTNRYWEMYEYGGRVMADRSQSGGASARRCLRVYKKFFHVEVADMLNCGLGYATSRVTSIVNVS